jgi:hypothetical protein
MLRMDSVVSIRVALPASVVASETNCWTSADQWTERCPIATHRGSIDEYSVGELVAFVSWIESDTLLRTEEELLAEALRTLGFAGKGSKITGALTDAIALARNRAAWQW